MTSQLEITDAESAAVQKTPNRVTLDFLKSEIAAQYVFNAYDAIDLLQMPAHGALKPLTVCVLVMKNGFTIIGKSAPADPENYNRELGEKFAYEDAVRQLWPLEGYRLRSALRA